MQAQKIIVIHPGSQNLRIGRAGDLNPLTILHAVARAKRCQNNFYHDTLLPKNLSDDKKILYEFESHRLLLQQKIQLHSPYSNPAKRLRVSTPIQQISTFNKRSVPEIISDTKNNVNSESDDCELNSTKNETNKNNDILFDHDILSLSNENSENYNIHFPIRCGELNLHSNIGGSKASVLADIEIIWLYGLRRLGITPKSLSEYTAVLVIADIYNRAHLRELVSILLVRLKFRACFLLQDMVAATFGAGLGYACVVDIGDQKCSISCVEDGISQPDSRVRLSVGGGDITQVFFSLLKKCCFPYKECDPDKDYADAALIQHLKERFCHINLEQCGAQERTFEVHKQGKHLQYTIQLGDECVLAPLSLFQTELLNITGKNKRISIQLPSSQQVDSEDCFDAEYIRETGRRNGRDQMIEGAMPVTGEIDEDAEEIAANDRDCVINIPKANEKLELDYSTPNGELLSIEKAIIRSIERCSTEDMKRKMYSCILLVGGVIKTPGFAKWLEKQLIVQRNSNLSGDVSISDINVFVKDMDSCIIAWKGAAIMSCLESAPELWISGAEWAKHDIQPEKHYNLIHYQQRFNWDCGIACVVMVMISTSQRENLLKNFDKICQEEGFNGSTWTIDLSYLLHRYQIKHEYLTRILGIDPNYNDHFYYAKIIDKDAQRITQKFQDAKNAGLQVEQKVIDMDAIIKHLAKYGPVILLTNASLLTCDICKQNILEKFGFVNCFVYNKPLLKRYAGHYVVLCGYDLRIQKLYYRNPEVRDNHICRCSMKSMDTARKAYGTDEDVLLIYQT